MVSVAAVKIVIEKKHSTPSAGRENLLTNVIEFVGLITTAFSRERAERAAEVAITGGFYVSDSAEPISEIVARQHCFRHVFWSERFLDYFAEFFNISEAAVIKYLPRQQRERTDCRTASDHNHFRILCPSVRGQMQHAVEAICEAG